MLDSILHTCYVLYTILFTSMKSLETIFSRNIYFLSISVIDKPHGNEIDFLDMIERRVLAMKGNEISDSYDSEEFENAKQQLTTNSK